MPVTAWKIPLKTTRQPNHSSFLTPSRSKDFEKYDRSIPRDVAIAGHHSRAHRLRPSQRENCRERRISCLGYRRLHPPPATHPPPAPLSAQPGGPPHPPPNRRVGTPPASRVRRCALPRHT